MSESEAENYQISSSFSPSESHTEIGAENNGFVCRSGKAELVAEYYCLGETGPKWWLNVIVPTGPKQ